MAKAGDMLAVRDGWNVYSANDQKIGTVAETYGDYLLVEKGFLFKKDLYIPTSAIRNTDEAEECVYLTADKEQIETMGWDQMPSTTGAGKSADAPRDAGSVELREEELHTRKTREQAGEVGVGKRVVSEEKTMNVPVTHEEVQIERRPVDKRPAEGGISKDEGTVRVPLSKEEVEVEKRPVVSEEVNVRKTPVTENQRVSETVQREEPVVNKDAGVQQRTGGPAAHQHHFVGGVCDCGARDD